MLEYVLYGIYTLACIVVIVAVLLQPGKADAGALFTSTLSSAAFGPRGTQTLLAKITIGAAAVFMLIALTLSLPAVTQKRSVLQAEPEATPQPTATPQPSPATSNSNAASTATTTPAASPQSSPEEKR
ncbi:preprotein translocase subunit SecG [Pyrinomonas sp.]|uniref:preprotein translocase subunit SecG n=1 Tax=Pyrinomonas sp. TaxID=2080306 RepID=UPI00331F8BDA